MTRITRKLMSPMVAVAKARRDQIVRRNLRAEEFQRKTLGDLLHKARNTAFGRDHEFEKIRSYEDFRTAVPLRDFDRFERDYWYRIYGGEAGVCWPGRNRYFISTGGSTGSGVKLIPTSGEHLAATRRAAVDAGMLFAAYAESPGIFCGRQLILGGSWLGEEHPSGARVFKMSGAGPATTPGLLRSALISPSYGTGIIEDFDRKMTAIARESVGQDIVFMAATPVWLLSMFERVARLAGLGEGDTLREVWPNLEMCMFSGAAIGTYGSVFRRWLGPDVPLWEMYAASEAAFAVMDDPREDGLLVLPDSKFFYEFIPLEQYGMTDARRVPLWEVERGREYAVVLSNPSGLFAYSLGDTVRFTSTSPYRLVVTGRTAHYLNTVGEHMTGMEVDRAVCAAQGRSGAVVREFTVGPAAPDPGAPPGHEWIVEFESAPSSMEKFARELDRALMEQNSDYKWFRNASVIDEIEIVPVDRGTFKDWIARFKDNNPQVKVPRLKNDRGLIEQIHSLRSIQAAA